MKYILALSCLFLCFMFAPLSYAAIEVGDGSSPVGAPAPPPSPTGGGKNCSFQQWKEDLGARESSGDYKADNGKGYIGKYQMGKLALIDTGFKTDSGNWAGLSGVGPDGTPFGPINSADDFKNSPAAQEYGMNVWSDILNNDVELAGLTKHIGKTVPECNIPITRSGMMAGRHLKGIGCSDYISNTECAVKYDKNGNIRRPGLKAYLETHLDGDPRKTGLLDPVDGNNTPVSQYVCKFSGYDTPYDNGGSASDADTCGTGQGTGTGGQGNGGMPYPGQPGAGKGPDSDPDGDGGYGSRPDLDLEGIKNNWIYGLMLMAEQFSVNMEAQLEAIGHIFDAKEQLEAERDFQRLTAQAHKDYQASEQMCTFGTFSMNLASTERLSDLTRDALAHETLQRELGSGDTKGKDIGVDTISRIKLFRDKFCNPKDNGGALNLLCTEETKPEMQNRDINYTQTIDRPLTLDVNLTDDTTTDDETAIFALIDYLFMHEPMPTVPKKPLEQQAFQFHYQNMRSIVAMRGIARNSFANIVALKTASPDQAEKSGPYLKALMKEMGLSTEEIEKLLGKNPSYYAQMEFLTKTIYQNPNFYTNLYDKPVNVERIRAAMSAIKLMNDRDIHDSMLRREMLLSMILELKLRERAEKVYDDTENTLFKPKSN